MSDDWIVASVTESSVYSLFFVIHFLSFTLQITAKRFKMHTGSDRCLFFLTAFLLFVSCQSDKNTVRKILANFEKEQIEIPSDLRFHCFLTDLERHPVIVGNPISDEKIKTLLFRYLSENSNTNFIYE